MKQDDLVERVAKALCDRAGSPGSYERTDEGSREGWRGDARAAIAALPAQEDVVEALRTEVQWLDRLANRRGSIEPKEVAVSAQALRAALSRVQGEG